MLAAASRTSLRIIKGARIEIEVKLHRRQPEANGLRCHAVEARSFGVGDAPISGLDAHDISGARPLTRTPDS